MWYVIVPPVLSLLIVSSTGTSTAADDIRKLFNHDIDLPSRDPLIIAHRGASGVLPEHTVEAYRLAIEHGADVIECDIAVTKDLQLVCLHDSWLNTTTNAHDIFPPDRIRTYHVELDDFRALDITGFFVQDFTLAELKTLRKKERYTHRNRKNDGLFLVI